MILPQKTTTIIILLIFTISSSTHAWSPASHFISPESTTDWKHQQTEGSTTLFHVSLWDKILEPWKKEGQEVRKAAIGSNNNDDDLLKEEEPPPCFFVRPALTADMGRASKILADGFFKENTNFITYQLERLETYLSLELGFPIPNTRHQVFVACEESTGKVLGVAEVDARTERPTVNQTGPYLCNLAVDLEHLRQGIATALVKKCEAQVQEWVRAECLEADIINETGNDSEDNDDQTPRLSSSLHLKVRQNNEKAIGMYNKLGYESILLETDKKNEKVLVMRKQLDRLEKKLGVAMEGSVNITG